ncbi:MAG: substrate-binding domain-containing protein [Methylobacter sp.]|uniref:PstS family phosphate ABC transporter substrate-binding protein n=1 Tax=Methylobacter sp. TaxID=2051955 RepID=UPI00258A7031|nr:substrate-binding domain-containing protein [Methylobacter sp.]MCL7423184.1 substrate-binding domain-containing protein [Methylobacter sp.]
MKTPCGGFFLKLARHLAVCFSLLSFAAAAETTAPAPVEGRLVVTGSIALGNLMTYWAQAFSRHNPLVAVTVATPGGMAGITALINGATDMALISTPVNPKQQEAFKARFGYAPHVIPLARDAVAVYVNRTNPLNRIALQDLDAIFSSTYRCSPRQPVRNWGDLGATGDLAQRRINAYGLTVETGTYNLFREVALCGGDFNEDFQALAGPGAVENAVSTDVAGIGFSSSTMHSSGMRALAVAPRKGGPASAPTPAAIRSGQYPMSRTLSIAVNRPSGQPLPPALKAFVDFVLSPEGQDIIAKAGYVPLP